MIYQEHPSYHMSGVILEVFTLIAHQYLWEAKPGDHILKYEA
jgi:hypothetical protein